MADLKLCFRMPVWSANVKTHEFRCGETAWQETQQSTIACQADLVQKIHAGKIGKMLTNLDENAFSGGLKASTGKFCQTLIETETLSCL